MPKPNDIPPCPEIPAGPRSALEEKKYEIQMITPLFGGGVEPGEPDPTLPIRATEIRGHLRFWWRATRGAQCPTPEDLFQQEAKIWGTTERASPVEVEVKDVVVSPPRVCAEYRKRDDGKLRLHWHWPFNNVNDSALSYVLFPFQGRLTKDRRNVEKPPAQFIFGKHGRSHRSQMKNEEHGSFTLHVRFPKALQTDVETAVWAWVNFGGLGARARRGCGALLCKKLAPKNLQDLVAWFKQRVSMEKNGRREWPTLPCRFLYHPVPRSPLEAWEYAVRLMRDFRQGVELGRNPGQQPNRPGRSRWPEPETIRRVTNHRYAKHPRLKPIPDDAFPRAELGLPIVFHFKDRDDPFDTFLYPSNDADGKKRERMASPLILKPLALANSQAVPLIMHLLVPSLPGIDLQNQNGASYELPPTTVIRDSRLAVYRNSPLKAAQSGSAIEAFLALAKDQERGFQEVSQ